MVTWVADWNGFEFCPGFDAQVEDKEEVVSKDVAFPTRLKLLYFLRLLSVPLLGRLVERTP